LVEPVETNRPDFDKLGFDKLNRRACTSLVEPVETNRLEFHKLGFDKLNRR
jgi:hypothetical protein